jgi:Pentapeptide repeats (8 copies)
MGVLADFIRERSGPPRPPPGPGRQAPEPSPRPDVQAAITALGRRLTERDLRPVDLAGADLAGADLTGADLTGADVTGANLNGAGLTDAKWPVGVRAPEGWRSETNSRLLTAAGTEPRSAEMNLVQ